VGLSHGACYRQPLVWMERDAEVIAVLNELIEAHPRWGFWKVVDAIHNQGICWNHMRICRDFYRMGLNQPRRVRRKLSDRPREPLFVPEQ